MIRFLLAAAFATLAASASAQQATPPAAPATPIAPAPCEKPGDHPGRLATDTMRRSWTRNANAYLDCLKKYIGEQQSAYNSYVDKAKPHLDAANGAIEEYNKAVAAFKAAAEN
jgi:hypothetical protein